MQDAFESECTYSIHWRLVLPRSSSIRLRFLVTVAIAVDYAGARSTEQLEVYDEDHIEVENLTGSRTGGGQVAAFDATAPRDGSLGEEGEEVFSVNGER